jgi:hypothetical protein
MSDGLEPFGDPIPRQRPIALIISAFVILWLMTSVLTILGWWFWGWSAYWMLLGVVFVIFIGGGM